MQQGTGESESKQSMAGESTTASGNSGNSTSLPTERDLAFIVAYGYHADTNTLNSRIGENTNSVNSSNTTDRVTNTVTDTISVSNKSTSTPGAESRHSPEAWNSTAAWNSTEPSTRESSVNVVMDKKKESLVGVPKSTLDQIQERFADRRLAEYVYLYEYE
jgi:hypothetical protein